jgi:hypothetical protein
MPIANADTKPFWDGCARAEFLLQRCAACQAYRHPPSPICPKCLSDECAWIPASGYGTVYSFTVVREQSARGWDAMVPYVLTVVELAEGPHVLTNLTNVTPEEVRIGLPVEVTFTELEDGSTLPLFQPRGAIR